MTDCIVKNCPSINTILWNDPLIIIWHLLPAVLFGPQCSLKNRLFRATPSQIPFLKLTHTERNNSVIVKITVVLHCSLRTISARPHHTELVLKLQMKCNQTKRSEARKQSHYLMVFELLCNHTNSHSDHPDELEKKIFFTGVLRSFCGSQVYTYKYCIFLTVLAWKKKTNSKVWCNST